MKIEQPPKHIEKDGIAGKEQKRVTWFTILTDKVKGFWVKIWV